MKRIRPVIIVVILVSIVSLAAWRVVTSNAAPPPNQITASGFIEAKKVNIGPEVPGRIVSLSVNEGDAVRSGDVMVKLDDSLIKAQQRQAEAAVAQSQASLDQTQAAVDQVQAAVQQAEMVRSQALTTQSGVKKALDNALEIQKNPYDLDAQLVAAQGQVDIAASSVLLATDNFRKLTYPYTYTTFAFDIPTAVGYMVEAQTEIDNARSKLQPGLTANQAAQASQQLQTAIDKLKKGGDLLARGQGQDVFTSGQSGLLTAKDFFTVRAAQLQMEQAQTALDTANKTLKIVQDKKNNPQQINAAVDSAQAVYDSSTAGIKVAEAAVTAAQKQMVTAQKQVDVVRKQVEQAQAAADVYKVQLTKFVLVSPLSGIVASRNAEVGEIAQAGASILTVTQLTEVTLTAYVPESNIGQVKLGQKAQVSVDSFPGQTFTGDITFISPNALFTPGNVQLKEEREKAVFAVKIKLPNREGKLKPGMSADAAFVAGS